MTIPHSRQPEVLAFLRGTPMFAELEELELTAIVPLLELDECSAGQVLFAEGDDGAAWYVVYSGEVEVRKSSGSGGDYRVARLGPGSCFGEMSVLDGRPRSASVITRGPSAVLRFPREAFARLLEVGSLGAHKLVHQMALVLVARQREVTGTLAQRAVAEESRDLRERLLEIVNRSVVAE